MTHLDLAARSPASAKPAPRRSVSAAWWPIRSPRGWLLLILLSGLAIRLALAPFGGFRYDLWLYGVWATRLVREPLSEFYAAPEPVDHLPGDMWLLYLLGRLYQLYSPELQVDRLPFVVLLKLVPTCADLGIGLLLFLIGRRLAGPRAGLLASALFSFNPGSIFLTAIWMSWDSLPVLFTLAAHWLLLRGQFEWSLLSLAYAALIKPPFAALGPLFLLAGFRRPPLGSATDALARSPTERLAGGLPRLGLALALCLLLTAALLLPFGVGLPPLATRWNLLERLVYGLDFYPNSWMNAFNLWGLWAMRTPRAWEPDDLLSIFGLSYRTWGTLLLGAAYGYILVVHWRRGTNRSLLWACLAVSFALFMLPTRVHQRYLLAAVCFAALAAAVSPRLAWFHLALSTTFLLNLLWSYNRFYPLLQLDPLYTSGLFVRAVSLLNLSLLIYLLFLARAWSEQRSDARSGPADAAADGSQEQRPAGLNQPNSG